LGVVHRVPVDVLGHLLAGGIEDEVLIELFGVFFLDHDLVILHSEVDIALRGDSELVPDRLGDDDLSFLSNSRSQDKSYHRVGLSHTSI